MRSFTICVFLVLVALSSTAIATSPVKDDDLTGKPCPTFEILDLAGNRVTSEGLAKAGKVVLVNFWGLRCGACLDELPHLNGLFERHKDRVEFLGVNVDAVAADVLAAQIRKKDIRILYRVIPDPEFRMADAVKMKGAPVTVVMDPGGVVRYQHENFAPGDEKRLGDVVRAILEGKSVPAQ